MVSESIEEESQMNRKSIVGVLLVALGVVAALVNLGVFRGVFFLPIVSAGLLSMYVAFGGRRHDGNLGFLIPGCIVAAIGLYAVLNDYISMRDSGGVFLMMLGAAFLAIMVVHTLHGKDQDWGARYWPIFPATGLILTGVAAASRVNFPWNIWNMIGPVALIVVGLSLWFKNRNGTGE